ncbi:MAG: TonB-dependent receptor [Odoribacteraceae bacterium]|jgi:hypothetical protein|nr:TonB-dependent receptor [Odoribacteraceae bacterium]
MKQTPRLLLALLLLLPRALPAGEQRLPVISGIITSSDTGQPLPGANLSVTGTRRGTVANADGHYAITLPRGKHLLLFSHVGHATREVTVDLADDKKLNIALVPRAGKIGEITVTSATSRVARQETGVERLPPRAIKRVPALLGEVDVIKAIQLLPGVQPTSEGSSGFSVRGGSHDQNLILLDDATVYNASHLMGFFSVFNNDAIKDVTLYKGDIPASFGGRLSSLLDIRSREGDASRFSATGGIGLISSRLTVETPIAGERASLLLSGRRTYADIFLAFSGDDDLRGTALYFHDVNARVDYRPGKDDHLYIAAYTGKDRFANKNAGMTFSNRTLAARWDHRFSPRTIAGVTIFTSAYNYYLKSDLGEQLAQDWASGITDTGLKIDIARHATRLTLKAGYNATYHRFHPGEGGGIGDDALFDRVKHPTLLALEHALHAAVEFSPVENLSVKAGARYTLFHDIANGEEITYLRDYLPDHSTRPPRGTLYHTYRHLEPRLGIAYRLDDNSALKASYARAVQHVQVASNSTSGSPLDIWFHATPNVKPQRGDQIAAGYTRALARDVDLSVEVYYRHARDVIDFKDHATLLGNADLEQEIRAGTARAAGIECMIRRDAGRLTGWASYTYARSRRQVREINDGKPYRSPNDKPHAVTIVASLEISPRWNASANWVYATGHPVTYPSGRFLVGETYLPLYPGRNESRFPDYHRLDLSVTRLLSRPGARLKSEINLSLYNAYGRKNPWTIVFRQEEDRPDISYAEQLYLFSVVPSITWNFTF